MEKKEMQGESVHGRAEKENFVARFERDGKALINNFLFPIVPDAMTIREFDSLGGAIYAVIMERLERD